MRYAAELTSSLCLYSVVERMGLPPALGFPPRASAVARAKTAQWSLWSPGDPSSAAKRCEPPADALDPGRALEDGRFREPEFRAEKKAAAAARGARRRARRGGSRRGTRRRASLATVARVVSRGRADAVRRGYRRRSRASERRARADAGHPLRELVGGGLRSLRSLRRASGGGRRGARLAGVHRVPAAVGRRGGGAGGVAGGRGRCLARRGPSRRSSSGPSGGSAPPPGSGRA